MSRGAKGKGACDNLFGLMPGIQLTELAAGQEPQEHANFCLLFRLYTLAMQCNVPEAVASGQSGDFNNRH
jgi:hypothetical protein